MKCPCSIIKMAQALMASMKNNLAVLVFILKQLSYILALQHVWMFCRAKLVKILACIALLGYFSQTINFFFNMATILALAGSNSSTSINYKLVQYTTSKIEGHQIQLLNMAHYPFPMYSADDEKQKGY
ncbi:MAG: NAD(P)H-dependent oxidoreductase, partial [Flavobacteriaceae bacterium]